MSPTEFLLLLHSVPHIGERAIARLLRLTTQQRLEPDDFLSMGAEEWQSRYELHPEAAEALTNDRAGLIERSAEMARRLRRHSVQLLSSESATYPLRLTRNKESPPPLLYALGALSLLEIAGSADRFTFTIAVSNGAAVSTLNKLNTLATDLVAIGGVPVTGHDRPPYQRLALAAQRLNLPTVYVLDRGLREAMGPEFDRPLFAAARIRDTAFDGTRDLVLSSFRVDDHSIGVNNRRRDAIIFGLADAIIALDVRAGGAMFDSCLQAARQGRPVYVAGDGRDGNARLLEHGCNALPVDDNWTHAFRCAIQ